MQQNWNANLYQKKHSFVYEYGKEVISWLNPKEGEQILDLGCGTGQLTAEIAKIGCKVVGIDSSSEMIKTASENYPAIDFEVGDASNFSSEKVFDAVFSNAALHWVNDPVGVLQCVFGVLKKEGRFVAEFGGENNVMNIIVALKESFKKRGIQLFRRNAVWYFPSVAEYAYLLEKNGFSIKRIHHIERPTELADQKSGIKDWLNMFGAPVFKSVDPQEREGIISETQDFLLNTNFINGKWVADYRRIRVEAVKV